MKNNEINIRDPFVLYSEGIYYMYGTRAAGFGIKTAGFDVYKSVNLCDWSEPKQVFDSAAFGYNNAANWAPEVHCYKGRYYMFATFEQENGNRGTYSLLSDVPDGDFMPLSSGALTPYDWMSLDGTLYISKKGEPYLVFCHEHVQIHDGTVCFIKLSEDLSKAVSKPVLLFYGSQAYAADKNGRNSFVTDGPFLFRGNNNRLYMIWSTIISGSYYQCIALSSTGEIDGCWTQLPPVFTENGGHGMLFSDKDGIKLTLHCPNKSLMERPVFFGIEDTGLTLKIKTE